MNHTHIHLLRTVIANSDVECILRAKNTPIKPDRNWLMTRGEKNRNGSLQTDCDSRTGSEVTSSGKLRVWVWFDTVWKKNRQGGSWVSHVPWPESKISQVRRDDQSRYHNLKPPSSLGSGWNEIHCPPAKLEVLHLFRWFTHTLSFTHNFVTRNFVTHNFFHKSQTTLSHTLSLTRNFVTHHLSHTTLSHIHTGICHTLTLRGRRGTWKHPPSLCVAGVALGDIHLRFAWQAWHLATSTFTLRGRRGTCGTGLALVARLGAVSRRWRRGTLRGRRGTWRHPPSFRVAGVALGDIHLRFAWQAWHLVTFMFHLRGTWVVTHHLSHTILSHTTLHTQLVLPPPLSFLPSPSRYNISCSF